MNSLYKDQEQGSYGSVDGDVTHAANVYEMTLSEEVSSLKKKS